MKTNNENCRPRPLEALGISETAEVVAKEFIRVALDNNLTVRELNQALDYAKVLTGHCKLTI